MSALLLMIFCDLRHVFANIKKITAYENMKIRSSVEKDLINTLKQTVLESNIYLKIFLMLKLVKTFPKRERKF